MARTAVVLTVVYGSRVQLDNLFLQQFYFRRLGKHIVKKPRGERSLPSTDSYFYMLFVCEILAAFVTIFKA